MSPRDGCDRRSIEVLGFGPRLLIRPRYKPTCQTTSCKHGTMTANNQNGSVTLMEILKFSNQTARVKGLVQKAQISACSKISKHMLPEWMVPFWMDRFQRMKGSKPRATGVPSFTIILYSNYCGCWGMSMVCFQSPREKHHFSGSELGALLLVPKVAPPNVTSW